MPSTLSVTAPVYVPMRKRRASSSSTASSTHTLTYSRDELLSMAPSTSTSTSPYSSPSHSPSSSPSSSGTHFPASFLEDSEFEHPHLEHTYAHPLGPSPHHPDAQGWLALNTAMREYLRLACPEIVMNRKMRKAVEFASFQHRVNASLNSKSAAKRERRASEGERERKERRASESKPKRERAPSPLMEEEAAARSDLQPEPTPASVPTTTPAPAARSSSTSSKRPVPTRRTPSSRAPRTPRTGNTRPRYNNFALFHRQLAGQGVGAGSEESWRRPVAAEVPAIRAC